MLHSRPDSVLRLKCADLRIIQLGTNQFGHLPDVAKIVKRPFAQKVGECDFTNCRMTSGSRRAIP